MSTSLLFIDLETGTTSPTNFPEADMGIYHYAYPALGTSDWATARNIAFGTNGGVVSNSLTSSSAGFFAAVNKGSGDQICGDAQSGNNGVLYNHRYWSFYGGTFQSTGNFTPAGVPVTGFLGVEFDDHDGHNHYAWVRVTSTVTAAAGFGVPLVETTIEDWAYQAQAEKCITAGELQQIPTLSEWGLITLSLLLLSFGTILIGKREEIVAGQATGDLKLSGSLQRPPFFAKYFKKALIGTGLLAAVMGAFSIFAYGEIAMVDFLGTMVAGPLFAYLMHLVTAYNDRFKQNQVK